MASTVASPPIRFPRDAIVRRIHDEGILLLGGGRALLLQIAHPSIARGVAEHSSFQDGRLERLLRTLRPVYALIYGSSQQAADAANAINRTHDRVHGEGYDAHDPDLLLWVWATLVDTTLGIYPLLVRRLTSEEATAYYEDMKQIGLALGVPASLIPARLDEFAAYMQAQIESLCVSDEARRIMGQVFRPAPPQWVAIWPLKHLTSGLLPPRVRDQFGLGWGPRRQRLLELSAEALRRLLPLTPRPLRRPPWFLLPPGAR